MTIKRTTIAAIMCSVALLAVLVSAQEKKSTHVYSSSGGQVVVSGGDGHYAFGPQGDNTFVFVSSEMSFDGKMVKGAPYSAQAITEMIQTLADGNRIVRRSNASVYRDSEGRTRREQSINGVGAFAASGEPQQTIFINDPVAEVNYILDTKNRTARKMDLNMVGFSMGRKKIAEAKARTEEKTTDAQHAEHSVEIARGGTFEMRVPGPGGIGFGPSMERTALNSKNAKKESLGKQNIEGVEAEGTRYTITIAAGEIGNEAPISIVSETWYSSELQTVVMSKHSDPRMGENTYRLTNINRSEPPHALFELPSDYTIKETIEPGMRYKIENQVRKGTEKQSQ
ncbi:MAG TPA: hypothetical protein VN743_06720 [Blastocatellia bacterium]|nr:hypothetical protein [Blastocatellia bacterium]